MIWVITLLLFLAVAGKLIQLQFFQFSELTTKAKESWDRELPYASERGNILDRNGEVIVGNRLSPTLFYMPSQNKEPEKVAKEIAPLLEVEESKLYEQINKRAYLVKIAPAGKNITSDLAMQIQDKNVKGLYAGIDYVRDYPHGKMLSRLLGFTGYDAQGLAGIEYQYDSVLKGKESAIRMFTDAKGIPLPHVDDSWKNGQNGNHVQLTIDMKIQTVVERELSQAMDKYEATQGIAIVMNPNNGEILALASAPNFDPSSYQEVDSTIYNRNLPVWMTFEPGSTFKIITLSAALEENVVNLDNDHFHDAGYTIVEGARLRCWKRQGHGSQTFLEVVENSCNPGFIELGRRVGPDKLSEYIKKFGFGQSTGSGMAGESSGILFSKDAYGPVEHATTSFGQGISVTPIQQVQAVAAAINGGYLYKPYIVKNIVDGETNKILSTAEPEMKTQVVSEATSQKVREALEHVVAHGSGRNAYRDQLRIGGKTGTAQKVQNGRYMDGEYIVSFIGFAPADKPELIVYVAIDNPKHSTQFGGVIAAPIVGQIIEDSLEVTGGGKQLEKDYRWGDVQTVRVPNLVGTKRKEITSYMYPFQIVWHGDGDEILTQLPKENSLIPLDGTIHVYTK
ncbi:MULTISPECIES: penicillin-binding transpeptidase domain-containing protein [unclassified Psychrobacillus]|uniref:penicillin-binding transpeptidase domain-containing protein n=1 Tax=unclassified Psychrobacillus TaxID=2636677 RepID=UPI00146D2AA7|nr:MULTISPECIES: penicillin-binding transpeptidase domain-containing protein [unclassified Psychrobacillus]MCM3357039.1 penicillin-binding transpeptidase domain-containing protein [Psychrobacillus sp. MER TA 171]NME05236.1 stage V sporulation protein D [Psychrobacillus sp. BL-248-WT-3]